jgi:serine phosphatase RsbU (regulator of sigma subunit)
LVNLIEDWDVLEEYAGEKLGFFQLLATDGMFEVRVQTGRVGLNTLQTWIKKSFQEA